MENVKAKPLLRDKWAEDVKKLRNAFLAADRFRKEEKERAGEQNKVGMEKEKLSETDVSREAQIDRTSEESVLSSRIENETLKFKNMRQKEEITDLKDTKENAMQLAEKIVDKATEAAIKNFESKGQIYKDMD